MTDERVIKALEQCGNIIVSSCKECPFHKKHNANCVRELTKDALDLIKRQQANIERYQKITLDINNAKSEAYKEFAERLKKVMVITHKGKSGYCQYETEDYYIDRLVKELTEGSNGE